MGVRTTAPGTPPRKRPYLALAVLCLSCCLAAVPAWAQVDRRPFVAGALGGGLFGAQRSGVEQTPKGPLVKGRHCDASAKLAGMLTWRLGVVSQDELVGLFDRVLCARTGEVGEVRVSDFGDAAADPFGSGQMRYSGQPELGGWEPGLQYKDPRANASVSYVGLTLDLPGVSLWEVQAVDRVRIWYAPFRNAPAGAVTFFFEYRGGRWVWTAASAARRA
jgi:hypothetical protein